MTPLRPGARASTGASEVLLDSAPRRRATPRHDTKSVGSRYSLHGIREIGNIGLELLTRRVNAPKLGLNHGKACKPRREKEGGGYLSGFGPPAARDTPTKRSFTMNGKFKTLGLTLVAMFAMTALSASAASAAEFHHEGEEDARVIASNAGEGNHVFTAGLIGSISCSTATFTGTSYVTSPQPTVTVTPVYGGCTFLGAKEVKVNTEGCTYRFNTPTGAASPFTGSVTILCPAGKKINFTAEGCTVEVGEQTVSSVSYTNLATSPKSVTVKSNVTGITYTGGLLCPGATGTHSNGTYAGSAISKAETTLGEVVGAFVQ